MDVHHTDLQAAHTTADGVIEGAQAGWVGASAAALQSKMTEWQETTTRLCGDIEAHGDAYQASATGYTQNDADAAEALDREV